MEKYKEFYIPTIPDKLTFKDKNEKKLYHKMFMWSILLEEQIMKKEGITFDQETIALESQEEDDTEIPEDFHSTHSNLYS